MKAINKNRGIQATSYTSYTKTKRYRVNIQPVEVDKDAIFTYYTDLKDLRAVVDSYIEDLSEEEDFQILVKLNQESENGTYYVDVRVNVCFEETKNLFYPPEPVRFYTEDGEYLIKAEEISEWYLAFTTVIDYNEYPYWILKFADSLITGNGSSSIDMPIYILIICYDDELNMFEAFPMSISFSFLPKERLPESRLEQRERVLQFRNFVDSFTEQDGLVSEKISNKRW